MTRWLKRLVAARSLQRQPDGTFIAVQPLSRIVIDQLWQDARTTLADVPFLIDYVERCGNALRGVLTGQISPLETLFPDGSFATTEALYQDWAQARYFNNIVRAVVEAATTTADKITLIEIGAGTGSTTSAVLPALSSDRATYTFTDVSDLFLDRARDKFKDVSVRALWLARHRARPARAGLCPPQLRRGHRGECAACDAQSE